MNFLKKIWRLLVGVKDALVLLFMLIFFGLLFALLSASPHSGSATEGALVLDLNGSIVEQPSQADAFGLISGGSAMLREHRLRDVVHALDTAAKSDRVKAVALDLDSFLGGGQAAIGDIAAALDRVRRANKPVIAYATAYSDDSYLLAAHASEVWLNPMGGVLITGPGGTNLYYKGLLDKIGVTANVYRAGTFKAAVEPFTRTDMSPESRQANEALAAALWGNWQQNVRSARPKAQVAAYASAPVQRFVAAGGDMAKAALAAGLVDRLGDRTDFGHRLRELVGTDEEQRPGSFRAIRYDAWLSNNPADRPWGEIGVLTIAGTIVDGSAGPGTAGAETIVRNLEKGLAEKSLKALVVRVDTPGGSTIASERIRQALVGAKRRGLPVVVSMGSVAASGGYWLAMPADRIFAEPETITGSIGVFGVLPSFEGTLQKLGVGADGVRTTPLSGEPDLLRGPSEMADQLLQMGVDNIYRRFIALVADARKLPPARVNEIAQGRVWDGGTARQLGLIDQFGSFDAAFAEAARLAKLDPAEAEPVYLEPGPPLLNQLLAGMLGAEDADAAPADAFSLLAAKPQHLLGRAVQDSRMILAGPAIQARCLDCPIPATPLRSQERLGVRAWLMDLLLR